MRYKKWATGGFFEMETAKVTKNKPKKSTIALFQMIESLETVQRKTIVEVLKHVNGRDNACAGYMSSTIAWHTNQGRLSRSRIGNKTFFSLTEKGRMYAKERGIL